MAGARCRAVQATDTCYWLLTVNTRRLTVSIMASAVMMGNERQHLQPFSRTFGGEQASSFLGGNYSRFSRCCWHAGKQILGYKDALLPILSLVVSTQVAGAMYHISKFVQPRASQRTNNYTSQRRATNLKRFSINTRRRRWQQLDAMGGASKHLSCLKCLWTWWWHVPTCKRFSHL